MKTLVLLRHAKSSWEDASLEDFDRPLDERGRKAAPAIAWWIRQEEVVPDLALCSAARRALDTWELVAPVFETPVPVRVEHGLYAADADDILRFIQSAADDVRTLLVVGHNPGLESVARVLAADGEKKPLKRMRKKFPTGAVAVIDFDIDQWAGVEPGAGTLRAFVKPKDLKKKQG
jgi:phosphohistidine phosphatase